MGKPFKELFSMLAAYFKRDYPPFIYRENYKNYLPIFYYHYIGQEEFENDLIFLSENGYKAIFCDEALNRLVDKEPNLNKNIMLTFDDGLKSLYTEIFPVIKKHKVKIVSYIVPAWIGKSGFISWSQCKEMYKSGLVDFQSHSNQHLRVIRSLKIKDVYSLLNENIMLWSIPGFIVDYVNKEFKWLPVFDGHSLFKAKDAYVLNNAFWEDCAKIELSCVDDKKLSKQEKTYLAREFKLILNKHDNNLIKKSRTELIEDIKDDLLTSRQTVEKKLAGHSVRHFAFPWHENSTIVWPFLYETGFTTGAVGIKKSTKSSNSRSKVLQVSRVNGDFIYCLPGKNRRTFLNVVGKKFKRRMIVYQ